MMDWTDRHCRAFHRAFTTHALLYTEMVTTGALLQGERFDLLAHDPIHHGTVALQIGGSEPDHLAKAAMLGEKAGFAEINLNCGCPSDRVQSGRFGACLMAEPELVAACYTAMAEAVAIPVTIKCRIGVDDQNPRDALWRFVDMIAAAGAKIFIVHARKAWLQGLSPKENRDIPPLDYPLVAELKAAFPELTIVLNGGLSDLDAALSQLPAVDGVMLGRAAYHDPQILGHVDSRLGGGAPTVSPFDALATYRDYVAAELARGTALASMTRHILGAYHNRPGARAFRRLLSTEAHKPGAGLALYDAACALVRDPATRLSA
jgi:tRNA-dihydrouridine synthase A